MQLVDLLQEFLGLLEGIAAGGGEGAQAVPLVADGLAAGVDGGWVIVVQSIQLLCDGCDLLHTVLNTHKEVVKYSPRINSSSFITSIITNPFHFNH